MKVGIMGGTFDPIHNGHLVTAEAVRDTLALDEVLFIPSARPPHKLGRNITSPEHRLAMTVLATCFNPKFRVSSIEIIRKGPSYAVDTIDALKSEYKGGTEFYFILGADAALELATWHNAHQLIEKCYFIAATREGTDIDIEAVEAQFGDIGRGRLQRVETPKIEISSTDIRDKIRRGHSIRYLVPDTVEAYIRKERLYYDDYDD